MQLGDTQSIGLVVYALLKFVMWKTTEESEVKDILSSNHKLKIYGSIEIYHQCCMGVCDICAYPSMNTCLYAPVGVTVESVDKSLTG